MAGVYGKFNTKPDAQVNIVESDTVHTNLNAIQFDNNNYRKHSVWLVEEKRLLWRVIASAIRGNGVYTIVLSRRDEVVHPNLSTILLRNKPMLFVKRNIQEVPEVLWEPHLEPHN